MLHCLSSPPRGRSTRTLRRTNTDVRANTRTFNVQLAHHNTAGIRLKKSTETFSTLDEFVDYFSVPRDGLPCALKVDVDPRTQLGRTVVGYDGYGGNSKLQYA